MEQLRLTLPELEQEEKQIRENLGGIVRNFVKTGWHLSRIDRSGAYKLKGYHSVTEYARETFGMTPDGVSRFIHVYEKYSVQGDTPELREEYRDFNFSQLTEMLQLPEEDHTMIRPETKREDIRALKKFNKQSEHNPDNLLNWQQDPDDIIRNIFQGNSMAGNLNTACISRKRNVSQKIADPVKRRNSWINRKQRKQKRK